MGNLKDAGNFFRKILFIQERVDQLLKKQEKVESSVNGIEKSIIALQKDVEHLRNNVKNEILADIKAEVVRTQTIIDMSGLLSSDKTHFNRIESAEPKVIPNCGG